MFSLTHILWERGWAGIARDANKFIICIPSVLSQVRCVDIVRGGGILEMAQGEGSGLGSLVDVANDALELIPIPLFPVKAKVRRVEVLVYDCIEIAVECNPSRV